MKLKQLIRGIEGIETRGSKEIEITGLSDDSRTTAPGNLFIARRGELFDGNQFIGRAIEAGASAVVADLYNPFLKATQLICKEPGRLQALLASRYYGKPSEELCVVGITGTKGKTTTSYLVRHLLEGLGSPCGLIGTVETIVKEQRIRSRLTTHGAIQNQKLLREMVLAECEAAVLEVSSHGLDQGRVDEIAFDMALFTNLFPDHLDYHRTIENYASAKRRLFEKVNGTAILNGDSPWSSFMEGGKKRRFFGIETDADVRAKSLRFTEKGTEFSVQGVRFFTPLLGRFNVYNMLGAIAIGLERGASLSRIAEILSSFDAVPGRMEPVPNALGLRILVDFAHTGEALSSVLQTAREIAKGRVIVVFGCGGDRDPGRRKGMGEAAARGADLAILTSDNPRNEDPETICRQILDGFGDPKRALVELDRKRAIQLAVREARIEDVVLIAGKGHEKTQIFAHQTIPFDDVLVAKEALQMRVDSAILSPF